MKSLSDQELLAVFEALPSLLDLADEQAEATGGFAYDIQDELRDQFIAQDKPCRWSMPYRSLFECFQCGLRTTQVSHMLFNPRMREISPDLQGMGINEEKLHYIREHGAAFSPECRKFLEQIAKQK
jgi:hypothetical protein